MIDVSPSIFNILFINNITFLYKIIIFILKNTFLYLNYQNDPEYENIKLMLDNPIDYAQSIISDRMPVPRFISADYASGQERLIKSTLDPNLGGAQGLKEGYFVSDDVSLKTFMEFLIKKAVTEATNN